MKGLFLITHTNDTENNNEEIEKMITRRIPETLKGWDKSLSEERDTIKIKTLAQSCFEEWKYQGQEFKLPYKMDEADVKTETACKDPDNMRFFETDKPKKSHYALHDESGEVIKDTNDQTIIDKEAYLEDLFDYRLNTAVGRRLCDSCPIQKQCLTASLTRKKAIRKPFSPENLSPDKFLIWGGLSPEERKLVFDEFEKMVISYYKSKKAENEAKVS